MQTPDRQRQLDRVSASPGPHTDRRLLAVPIAFLLGAALAGSLLLAAGGHRAASAQPAVAVPARTAATSQSAQVLQLLADEAREVQAQRLQRLHAKSLLIAAHAAAVRSAALRRQERARRAASAHASGGTAAPAHTARPQSRRSLRGSATRQPKTHEHPRDARRGSGREHHEQTAQRRKQETAERREQHAQTKEERAASRHGAKGAPRRGSGRVLTRLSQRPRVRV